MKKVSRIEPVRFHFPSSDRMRISCARWGRPGRIRGVVQIAHGMGEHAGRYKKVITALVEAGFTVYANDHRGHGLTALDRGRLGDFGPGGFDLLVEDMAMLSRIARREAANLPLILMGHSMGSFAAQQYILDHSGDIDGLVLSGSGTLDGLAGLVADNANNHVDALDVLNARFTPTRTPADWLSRDTKAVNAFLSDPLCFAELQPASLLSFFAAAERLADPAGLRCIRSDLPVYLLSGSEDPIGQQGQGVGLLVDRYRGAGIIDIRCDLYPDGRHEMLNEINQKEVRTKLIDWISTVRKRPCLHDDG